MTSEGTETTRTLEFLAWLEVNKKRLAIGGAAILAVCCTVATVQWLHRERERAASAALLELESQAQADGEQAQPPASAYQTVATERSGTRAAGRAELLAAGALFREGHYEEARQAFEKASSLVREEFLVAAAAYGTAASLEALDRLDEAAQAYQRVVVEHPTAAVAGQARLAVASLHEQRGEWAQALSAYAELTNNVESAWSELAAERSDFLLTQHPELAPVASATEVPAPAAESGTNTVSGE